MFTDRLFSFRVGDGDSAWSACLKSGRWHWCDIVKLSHNTPRVSVLARMCHPKTTRGIIQPEAFNPDWMTGSDYISPEISPEFVATVPDRAGLIEVDTHRIKWATPAGNSELMSATGYRCHEEGRVAIACPQCGSWHVTDLDEVPEPGYRLTVLPDGCIPLRVTVDARSWRAGWASRGKDGRRRTVECSTAYVDALNPSRAVATR